MNFLELQANYRQACLKYASDIADVTDVHKFCVINMVENKTKTLPTDPNYVSVITTWNHSSPQPTDEQLMHNTVADVQALWTVLVDLPVKINATKMAIVTEPQKVQLKRKLVDGAYVYNKTQRKMEILVDGEWADMHS
jgi:hypothetical protein